ncbi:MAG: GNAT family N-acetyltransferase [Gemmatimonadetes bacterium]|nr:GNAT family N-acetyltransferase [Gemmatimonadota bacterium]
MPTDARAVERPPASTAAAELTLRPATEADTEEIIRLVRTSLGEFWNVALKLPFDIHYWSWKHLDNTFGTSPCLVAEAGGKIVGVRVFMRWQWQLGGRHVQAVRALDTATHPEWRGKGIFSRLTLALVEEMRREGVSFVFNTPNNLSRPGYLKMGWSSMGRVSLWIRPLRPIRMLRTLLSKSPPAPAAGAAPGGSRIGDLFREPRLESFLQSLGEGDGKLRTPRTREYLQWRYGDIPGGIYDAAWDLDGSEGAVVIFRRKNRGALSERRFCEILVGPGSGSVKRARTLLRELMANTGVDYASAMAGSAREQRLLLRSGFLPAPRLGPILTVRPLNPLPGGVDPLDRSRWRFSLGDLELF